MAIVNRKARHDYHILETFEAGMILTGPEVKFIRIGQASLAEAHCIVRNAKLNMGLARGKKLYDKRQAMKERDVKHDLARNYKAR